MITEVHEHRGAIPTHRLEALADGVFAIAATLLILDVSATGAPLASELVRIWPSYAAYFFTFISIGIAWINHSTVISLVDRMDRTFLILNLFLLAFVGFIPFPTRLLAVHLFDADAQAAVLAYGITLFAASLFFNAIWFYGVLGRGLLTREADAHLVQGISRSYVPGPLLFGSAVGVALVQPLVSAAMFAAIILFYLVEATIFARG